MLQEDFVPVAIDQWYERRQQDAKGDFYRKIAGQGPRNDFKQTTQGHYACDATGKLYGYNGNHIDLTRLKALMQKALLEFDPETYKGVKPIEPGTPDSRFHFEPPADGLVFRVFSKILDGYDEPKNAREAAFQKSIGQDMLWIQADEKDAIVEAVKNNAELPVAIKQRIARFHLIDNTRGEPPRWSADEVQAMNLKVTDGTVTGAVKLASKNGRLGYEADLYGHIETEGNEITRFDLVAEGMFFGEGRFTGSAPKGKFPLVVTFRLVDGDALENQSVPHGAKGWIDGYYETAGK